MKEKIMSLWGGKKREIIFVAGTSIVLLSCLTFVVSASSTSSKKVKPVLEHLSGGESEGLAQKTAVEREINNSLLAIEQRLALFQKEISQKDSSKKTEAFGESLKDLSKTVSQFKSQAQSALEQSRSENQALNKKVEAMHALILSLKGQGEEVHYLDKKALPFEIRAIDSVNEEPLLALSYHYNNLALEKGDKLAGWKITALDYAHQFVEFDDEKGSHVKLSLAEQPSGDKKWA